LDYNQFGSALTLQRTHKYFSSTSRACLHRTAMGISVKIPTSSTVNFHFCPRIAVQLPVHFAETTWRYSLGFNKPPLLLRTSNMNLDAPID
jgi:hypothetical protein